MAFACPSSPISLKPARRSGSCRSCLFCVVRQSVGGAASGTRAALRSTYYGLQIWNPFSRELVRPRGVQRYRGTAEPHIPASAAPVSWRTRATPRGTGVATSLGFPFACVCKMVLKRLANFRTRGRPWNEPRIFF